MLIAKSSNSLELRLLFVWILCETKEWLSNSFLSIGGFFLSFQCFLVQRPQLHRSSNFYDFFISGIYSLSTRAAAASSNFLPYLVEFLLWRAFICGFQVCLRVYQRNPCQHRCSKGHDHHQQEVSYRLHLSRGTSNRSHSEIWKIGCCDDFQKKASEANKMLWANFFFLVPRSRVLCQSSSWLARHVQLVWKHQLLLSPIEEPCAGNAYFQVESVFS